MLSVQYIDLHRERQIVKETNYELEQSWNDEVATCFDTRLRGLTTLKISLRLPGVPAEIRKDILSNTILEHSCYTNLLGCFLLRRNWIVMYSFE